MGVVWCHKHDTRFAVGFGRVTDADVPDFDFDAVLVPFTRASKRPPPHIGTRSTRPTKTEIDSLILLGFGPAQAQSRDARAPRNRGLPGPRR